MDYTAVEKMANLSGVFEPTEVIVFPFCTATWKQKFNFIHSNDLEVEFKRKRGIIVQWLAYQACNRCIALVWTPSRSPLFP